MSFVGVVLGIVALVFTGTAMAATTITSTLDFGDRGANVTSLQQYLAMDSTIYPEGLVTGYFGSLTESAVERFQCRQNIVCAGTPESTGYGRVGPRTLAALNAAITGGSVSDSSAPIMSRPVISTTTGSATIMWTSNELARGTVHYSPSPLPMLEGSPTGPAVMGGQPISEVSFGLTHNINVAGLAPNTSYFYALKSEDVNGNVTYSWPTVFVTAR